MELFSGLPSALGAWLLGTYLVRFLDWTLREAGWLSFALGLLATSIATIAVILVHVGENWGLVSLLICAADINLGAATYCGWLYHDAEQQRRRSEPR